jgi:hypothetical protein
MVGSLPRFSNARMMMFIDKWFMWVLGDCGHGKAGLLKKKAKVIHKIGAQSCGYLFDLHLK